MERHAIIAGGSSGLGLSLAGQLLQRGTDVTLLDSRDASDILPALRALASNGATVRALKVDVTSRKEVEDAIREAEKKSGVVDFLATCSGHLQDSEMEAEKQSADAYVQSMAVNFHAVVHSVQSVLPGMLAHGRGTLLLVSSVFAVLSLPGKGPSACSSAAVKAYADSLRLETLGTGVSVHLALPGQLEKSLSSQLRLGTGQVLEWIKSSGALGRLAYTELAAGPEQLLAWLKASRFTAKPLHLLLPLTQTDPDQVVAAWLSAMKRGAYILPSSLLVSLLVQLQAGVVAPGLLWWPLDLALAPAQTMLRTFLRGSVEIMCSLSRQRVPEPSTPPIKELAVRRRQWLDTVLYAEA